MSFIWMLIIGLVVGALAKFVIPGKQDGGMLATMLLGVAGAVLVGFLGRAMGWYDTAGEGPGIIASVIGAVALVLIYGAVTGRKASRA
ncbi:MAG: GlsB/YeaQ/YmgE family stress response membrane protein [Myxococcales bacterium]|nr:GlsB/YeaQ/YmgE family stress response membrane protein [Myxococcales bacterium]